MKNFKLLYCIATVVFVTHHIISGQPKTTGTLLYIINNSIKSQITKRPNNFAKSTQLDFLAKETLINFDRESIVEVEGYWASDNNESKDRYHGKFPIPNANPKPWAGQEEFLERLQGIESCPSTDKVTFRGFAPSRFEKSVYVGSSEYKNESSGKLIQWTEAFRSYYVAQFNVKPSREFYRFVMTFLFRR